MIINTFQETMDRENEKPKIKKAMKAQREFEKRGGVWVKVESNIKSYYKFIPKK
jgi:hypothetical protein